MGRKVHGETGTRMHNIWNSMMYRCSENSRHKEYKDYGGKGICVCEDWHEYSRFKAWALSHGYKDNLTLERVDNNGNYEPNNCTWIPKSEQALNRDNTVYVAVVMPLVSACRLYNLSYSATRNRIKNGQNINEIIKNRRINNYGKRNYNRKRDV